MKPKALGSHILLRRSNVNKNEEMIMDSGIIIDTSIAKSLKDEALIKYEVIDIGSDVEEFYLERKQKWGMDRDINVGDTVSVYLGERRELPAVRIGTEEFFLCFRNNVAVVYKK